MDRGFRFLLLSSFLLASPVALGAELKPVLADSSTLEAVGAKVLATHAETGVGFANITAEQERKISEIQHKNNRCGGYQVLPGGNIQPNGLEIAQVFGSLSDQAAKNKRFTPSSSVFSTMERNPAISAALDDINEDKIGETIRMMSSFHTRLHNGSEPNRSVEALRDRIQAQLSGTRLDYKIDLISHSSTPQKSIRVSIPGKSRASEIVILGGHQDSINASWYGEDTAPGADDNASGSADLLEALRVMAVKGVQPERTVEFMWYAGEEAGLLGSAEIARDYKRQSKDVVGVMQLDMTYFPGDGELVIASMTDFTNAWLRGYFLQLNQLYIGARVIEDRCGYGCSDHASWHREGFPAFIPFEASMRNMNERLHTTDDIMDSRGSLAHSKMFAKVALAFAMDLGNSTLRQN